MFAFQDSIVCGVDGRPAAGELARIARDLATALGAPLNVVHVLGASPGPLAGGSAQTLAAIVQGGLGFRRRAPGPCPSERDKYGKEHGADQPCPAAG